MASILHIYQVPDQGLMRVRFRWDAVDPTDTLLCKKLGEPRVSLGGVFTELVTLRSIGKTDNVVLSAWMIRNLRAMDFSKSLVLTTRTSSSIPTALTDYNSTLWKFMKQLVRVTSLNLSGCKMMPVEVVEKLLEFGWNSVNLSGCSQLPSSIGNCLSAQLRINYLDLSFCTHLDDAIGEYLGAMPQLVTLKMRGCFRLTFKILPSFGPMSSLQELDLSRCFKYQPGISDEWPFMENLQTLALGMQTEKEKEELEYESVLGREIFRNIIKKMPKLSGVAFDDISMKTSGETLLDKIRKKRALRAETEDEETRATRKYLDCRYANDWWEDEYERCFEGEKIGEY